MGDYKQRTFTLPEGVSAELNEYADENDMAYSQVVARAVEEYLDNDRLERIEDKLDVLIAESDRGPTPSENEPAKENTSVDTTEADSSDEDSGSTIPEDVPDIPESGDVPDEILEHGPRDIGKNKDGNADRMVNYLALANPDTEVFGEPEIHDAIERIGGSSDYYFQEYPDMIEDRLDEIGWELHAVSGAWVRSSERYGEMLDYIISEFEEALTKEDAEFPTDRADSDSYTDQIWELQNELQEIREDAIEHDVRTPDEMADLIENMTDYALETEQGVA